MKESYHKSL